MGKLISSIFLLNTLYSFGQYEFKAYEEAIKSIKVSSIFVSYCQQAGITNKVNVSTKTFSNCNSFIETEIQKEVWDYCFENNITNKDQNHRELKKLCEKRNSPLLIRFSEISAGYFIGIVSIENRNSFLRFIFKFVNGKLEFADGNFWTRSH